MKKILAGLACATLAVAWTAARASGAIQGDYVEVRSADIYTGPCFANAEVNLDGKQAMVAWRVRHGNWQGVPLSGLSVVAVVEAQGTLGDQSRSPYPARAVLILDQHANQRQREALVKFARAAGGPLLGDVVRVETAPIVMEVGEGSRHGNVKMAAGKVARIETRSLCQDDHLCGNEEVYYPPLTRVAHAMPAYTLDESYSGAGLGVVWDRAGARSAFVGHFSL